MVGFTHAATRPSQPTDCVVQAWFRLQARSRRFSTASSWSTSYSAIGYASFTFPHAEVTKPGARADNSFHVPLVSRRAILCSVLLATIVSLPLGAQNAPAQAAAQQGWQALQ